MCVGSVRDGRRAHGMCVVELDVAGSGVAFGEWRLGVGPVWGLMVGVDDDGRQRWKLSVGLFACLCGVVAMLRLCCVWVWVCCCVVRWDCVCVCLACGVASLSSSSIGAEGAAAIGARLVHVPSLTTLEYVRTRRWFWVEGGSVTGLCRWVW